MKALLKYLAIVVVIAVLVFVMVCLFTALKTHTQNALLSFMCLYLFIGIIALFALATLKALFKESGFLKWLLK